jgi:hypothetical protein
MSHPATRMTIPSMIPGLGTVGNPIPELVAAAIAVDVGFETDPSGPPDDITEAVFPVIVVVVALLTVVEMPKTILPVVGIADTWVNGTADPAVQVAAAPRLMLLSIGSP